MKEYPQGGLIGKTVQLFRSISRLQVPLYAANAGYFLVLAVFPMLVLLLGMLRYTGLSVDHLTTMLEGIIPDALMPGAKRLILSTYYNSSGTLLSVSALTALWSASRGIYGLLTGLNNIYGAREDRGYFYTRTISVLYTFAVLLVLLLTLVLHVFGSSILRLLPVGADPFMTFLSEVVDLRFFLLLFLQTALFTAIFVVLPNRRNRIRDSLPGAMFSSGGWLIFSDIYSGYVNRFSGYANIYGSVYAIALSMLWLYCCMSLVFYGGALNVYLKSLQEK